VENELQLWIHDWGCDKTSLWVNGLSIGTESFSRYVTSIFNPVMVIVEGSTYDNISYSEGFMTVNTVPLHLSYPGKENEWRELKLKFGPVSLFVEWRSVPVDLHFPFSQFAVKYLSLTVDDCVKAIQTLQQIEKESESLLRELRDEPKEPKIEEEPKFSSQPSPEEKRKRDEENYEHQN